MPKTRTSGEIEEVPRQPKFRLMSQLNSAGCFALRKGSFGEDRRARYVRQLRCDNVHSLTAEREQR